MMTFMDSTSTFSTDSIPNVQRGKCVSAKDKFGIRAFTKSVNDAKVHDANFAFLSTQLAKLHQKPYEPKYWITWAEDVPSDTGGGFVDYVEYLTVDWAGIMSEYRNVVGNNANYIPRVNAGMTQNRVNVYTFQIAYDLRFIDLEKMKKLQIQKSIQEIYENSIVAQWDLFVQHVAYNGMNNINGLFTNTKVAITTIPNEDTLSKGFDGLTDDAVVAFFNGVIAKTLQESNMNVALLPDTFLVPTFVAADLANRFSALYSETLYGFLVKHNLAAYQTGSKKEITIAARPALDELGTAQAGRIVAYKKDKTFVRIDIPYPLQHYVTLPNIDKMSYTSAFVGQVSEVQLPYNTSANETGVVTYWDFTTKVTN